MAAAVEIRFREQMRLGIRRASLGSLVSITIELKWVVRIEIRVGIREFGAGDLTLGLSCRP
jgi:hypothetical protein